MTEQDGLRKLKCCASVWWERRNKATNNW